MAETPAGKYKVSKPERLFALTCALLYSKVGLSKHQILSSIPGYMNEYQANKDNKTLERKFERDKDTLRHNGINVVAVIPAYEDENNQATVYVIKKEEFSWPEHIKLTPRQLALLTLASEAWAGGSLSTAANKGIIKLRSMGVVGEDSDISGIAPRIVEHEPNFREINNAISDKRVIRFDYRNPNTGVIEARTLDPWVLKNIEGQWLVLGYDHKNEEPRNFMLRRIISRIVLAPNGVPFESPSEAVLKKAKDDLEAFADKQVAKLKIKPDSSAWFKFKLDLDKKNKDGIISRRYYDKFVMAEQIREFAGQIEVLEPKELKDLVEAGYKKVADLHG
jgi:proteasome accessory factor B